MSVLGHILTWGSISMFYCTQCHILCSKGSNTYMIFLPVCAWRLIFSVRSDQCYSVLFVCLCRHVHHNFDSLIFVFKLYWYDRMAGNSIKHCTYWAKSNEYKVSTTSPIFVEYFSHEAVFCVYINVYKSYYFILTWPPSFDLLTNERVIHSV